MIQSVTQIKNGTNIDVDVNVKNQRNDICAYAIVYGVLECVPAIAIKILIMMNILIILPV